MGGLHSVEVVDLPLQPGFEAGRAAGAAGGAGVRAGRAEAGVEAALARSIALGSHGIGGVPLAVALRAAGAPGRVADHRLAAVVAAATLALALPLEAGGTPAAAGLDRGGAFVAEAEAGALGP
jgi:hypothetical protein